MKQVAGKLAIGLVVAVVLLTLWPDATMPRRFITGYQSVRALEESRIWDPVELAPEEPVETMYEMFQENLVLEGQRAMPEEAQFLWDSCMAEVEAKVAHKPVSKAVMDQVFGRGRYTALPYFVVVQACGKKRRIDNAKAQGANAATRYTEKFGLANAFAPAAGARALRRAVYKLGLDDETAELVLHLESGGEDMPDAFRSIPIVPEPSS